MRQVLIALDQLFNALCGGWADETLSAHAYRSKWSVRERLINALFFSETHCQESYVSEMQRLQSPPEERMPSA